MNHIFRPHAYFTVPDGTDVSAFLNATDATQSDVPWGALGHMSIASGRIGPKIQSWVHVLPLVTQVTYVTSGSLTIRMKDRAGTQPYELRLRVGEAVVTQPGTLFQLHNESDGPAEVLYIVSPSYVFEMEGDLIKYDDAVLVAKTWEELALSGFDVPALRVSASEVGAKRQECLRRLGVRKGVRTVEEP